MSTNVIQVPAHIQALIAARREAEGKSSILAAVLGDGFSFPKISIKASRFRLVEDGVETPVGINLDVVIVGANPNISKVFYGKPFTGEANVRPDCFSNDGVRPDASVQNPVSSSCQTCPHNVLGTKINPSGTKTKMCADQRHLAVVAAADPSKVYDLTVPVSGMKSMREYFKHLQNYGLTPEMVVTTLGFDDTATFPKITFGFKSCLAEGAIEKVAQIVESDEVKEVVRLIPPSNRRAALAAPAPAAMPAVAASVPQAAPMVEDGYEDEAAAVVEAPAPVQKPKVTKPAPAQAAEPSGTIPGVSELESKLDDIFGS